MMLQRVNTLVPINFISTGFTRGVFRE